MKILTKLTLLITVIICGGVNANTNISPGMTFGDLPVVGVLGETVCISSTYSDSGFGYCTGYGASFAAGNVAGLSCPANTVALPVNNGFDFSQYNGWNGLHYDRYSGINFKVGVLCVVAK